MSFSFTFTHIEYVYILPYWTRFLLAYELLGKEIPVTSTCCGVIKEIDVPKILIQSRYSFNAHEHLKKLV